MVYNFSDHYDEFDSGDRVGWEFFCRTRPGFQYDILLYISGFGRINTIGSASWLSPGTTCFHLEGNKDVVIAVIHRSELS